MLYSSYLLGLRVNDVTVPYCTAAIETEDLFAEYQCNGLDRCVLFNSFIPISDKAPRKMEEQYEYVIKEFAVPETPPPKPAPLSQEWLNTMKPRPLLPPAAQFRFPFNLVCPPDHFIHNINGLFRRSIAYFLFLRYL
jgi:hypothetical protein